MIRNDAELRVIRERVAAVEQGDRGARDRKRRYPEIDFRTATGVGLAGLKDADVLALAARDGRVLITHDLSLAKKDPGVGFGYRGRALRRAKRRGAKASSPCRTVYAGAFIGRSWMIIQLMPNRSRNWPNLVAKNVSCIGMNTSPPSERAEKMRSASASLSTRNDR